MTDVFTAPRARLITHRRKPLIYHEGLDAFGGNPYKGGFIQPFTGRVEKRLKKAGYKVGSLADVYHYPSPYKEPRECQKAMLKFHLKFRRSLNLSEMRTGKTLPAVWHIDIKMRYYGLQRTLIIAPLATILDTWAPAFLGALPHLNVYYAIDSGEKCKQALASGKYSVVVINPRKVDICLDEIQEWNPEHILTDEFTEFKSPETDQYEAYEQLFVDECNWRSGIFMSGTPCPQRPTDVWSIVRFVNPATPKEFKYFEDQVINYTGGKYNPHEWEPSENAIELVAGLLQPSIRFRTDEVNEMPDHEHVSYRADMGKSQQRIYNSMRRSMAAEDDGQVVTAANAAVRMFKLLQIANGAVYGDEDDPPVICGAAPKLAEMLRLIRETPRQTVIMVGWKVQQTFIMEYLKKNGYKPGLINGQVKGRKRQKLIDDFQAGKLNVLVCHPKTTKHGLTLDAASLLIWFGATVSSEYFLQASARIRGAGTGKTVVAELRCSELELDRFERLREMKWTQEQIVDTYRKHVLL